MYQSRMTGQQYKAHQFGISMVPDWFCKALVDGKITFRPDGSIKIQTKYMFASICKYGDWILYKPENQEIVTVWNQEGFNIHFFQIKDPGARVETQVDWTNVEEALPTEDGRYLVTMICGDADHHVTTRYFRKNGYYPYWHRSLKNPHWERGTKGVIAWAPLPKPY